jgi:CubicO group peptidase (beta-lactamase class C family)
MTDYTAYHGVSGPSHQQHVDQLSAQGYRPVSISVSGDPLNPRYGAVWVRRPGPAWWAIHGLSATQYQARFTELVSQGYAPVLVSAAGSGGNEIFAAVFEQGMMDPWFARHGLRWDPVSDPDTVTHENQRAFDSGFIPRCLAVYGPSSDPRFAGIWVKNTTPTPWSWWWTPPDAYQRFFDAELVAGLRPAYLSVASDGWLVSVFRDDQIGPWQARHNVPAPDYQAVFEAEVAAGLRPLLVQAGGTGSGARYAAVFARDDAVTPRRWVVTGADFNGAGDLDAGVRSFMTAHAIRAGTVAFARAGRVIASRGYTWAEAGYPITQPTTLFRIASLSKIFTAAAIARLVSLGRLTWSTKAFGFLGVNAPPPTNPAIDDITLEQLVLRISGLARDFDQDLRIAASIGRSTTPTLDDLIRYLYRQPLASTPGTAELYSNTAFFLLTAVVVRASGRPFIDEVRDGLLKPLGIDDVFLAATAAGARRAGEVAGYDHPGVKASQVDLRADLLTPNAYGGDFVLETGPGAGGLLASAPSLARFIADHPVWNGWNGSSPHLTGRELATRYGTLDGTISGAVSRGDGLDMAFVFNRRTSDAEHDQITALINNVLDVYGAVLGA